MAKSCSLVRLLVPGLLTRRTNQKSSQMRPTRSGCARLHGPTLTALFVAGFLAISVSAQTQNEFPRTKEGKPDLTGIWQALDTSLDWDIQPHSAEPGPMWQLGAEFSVQPGIGA